MCLSLCKEFGKHVFILVISQGGDLDRVAFSFEPALRVIRGRSDLQDKINHATVRSSDLKEIAETVWVISRMLRARGSGYKT